eukprot:scaffold221292_cov16-Tisochrysis_lutea.AAC.2
MYMYFGGHPGCLNKALCGALSGPYHLFFLVKLGHIFMWDKTRNTVDLCLAQRQHFPALPILKNNIENSQQRMADNLPDPQYFFLVVSTCSQGWACEPYWLTGLVTFPQPQCMQPGGPGAPSLSSSLNRTRYGTSSNRESTRHYDALNFMLSIALHKYKSFPFAFHIIKTVGCKPYNVSDIQGFTLVNLQPEYLADQSLVKHI